MANEKHIFRDDFYWITRNRKGIYSWLGEKSYRLFDRVLDWDWPFHPKEFGRFGFSSGNVLSLLLHGQLFENPLLDILIKSLVRAETRLCSRFIPQNSHEERLTGNFVSEIDSAFFLIKEEFRCLSQERYGQAKEIDFYYYDLSRGGKAEKISGADLGIIFVLDLPDLPYTIRSIRLQAKKVNNSAQIDIQQFRVLTSQGNDSAYLFYDMNPQTYCTPIVYESARLEHRVTNAESENKNSFSLPYNEILDGIPLSLYIYRILMHGGATRQHDNFSQAFNYFQQQFNEFKVYDDFYLAGRIAIVSIGQNISLTTDRDGGLSINV